MISTIKCNVWCLLFFWLVRVMKKITVVGGDVRLKIAVEELKKNGFLVDSIGLFDNEEGILEQSDAVLFPVPTTRDNITVFAPFSKKEILLSDIEKRLKPHQLILCCNYRFDSKICIDYGNTDSFALLNAIPTAEAAISLCVENTDFTLWNSRVLITGFGRVGKILADRLYKLGAEVTISARKSSDFALALSYGYKTLHTMEIKSNPLDFDIIFNTLDFTILDEALLKKTTAKLLIDLSSKGGFDIPTAKRLGIKTIKAPGLPGKTAPLTAGKILTKTIMELLD